MERIETQSTSQKTAAVSDIVVRESPTVRLVFRPTIVDNQANPAACIRGTFLYQKKGKADSWEDHPIHSLASLKKGEGYQLDLHAGELLPLLTSIRSLYGLYRREGVPRGRQQFVRLEKNLVHLLQLTEPDLHEFLNAHSADAISTLHKVLRWLSSSTALSEFVTADTHQVDLLSAVLGVASLRSVLKAWETNQTNGDETFWQGLIKSHAFVFSQLFAYPVIVLKDKGYVGGKTIDNQHGHLVDFLAAVELSGNALIVELKTPTTKLLGSEYRVGAFPTSRDLSGSIAQVLKYRDSLQQSINDLDERRRLLRSEPRCLVVIGNASELVTPDQVASFERFRDRLQGVTVVTFDELFKRVSQLEQLLSRAPASSTT